MGELGNLLEALHGPTPRFESLHARLRTWVHVERQRAAIERRMKGNGGWVAYAPIEPIEQMPSEHETETEVWIAGDRCRQDSRDSQQIVLLEVAVGDTWWRYEPHGGATTNDGEDPPTQSDIGIEWNDLWNPWLLVPALTFRPQGETTILGRPALRATARPREDADDWNLHVLGMAAEEYELVVDRERGVLLRKSAREGGREYHVVEIEEIEFDTPIADETFVFRPPEGVVARTPGDVERPVFGKLHEIASAAPFVVWAPGQLAEGWQLRAFSWTPDDDHIQVNLHYHRTGPETGSFGISQSPASQPWGGYNEADELWRPETHGGRDMRVLERDSDFAPFACVKLQLDDTRIELQSQSLELSDLIALATSLQPAPTEPPPVLSVPR